MSAREPDRLLREDPTLPADLRRAFAGYGAIAPEAATRDVLFARLDRRALDAVEDAVAVPGAKAGHHKLWLVLSLLGLSLAGPLLWRLASGEAAQAAPGLGRAVDTDPGATTMSSAPVGAAASAPEAPPDVLNERPIVLPAPRALPPPEKRAHARKNPTAPVASRQDPDPVDPAQELALLMRAKRVLPSDAPAALNLTREHAARFPRGVFREEREVIAIEALARGGQHEQALSRASAFRQAFPRSTHLDRLAVILREP